MKLSDKLIKNTGIMKKENKNTEKSGVPPWLQTGVISLDDIIDIIIVDNSNYDRQTVKKAMIEFQKVLFKKLKEDCSVKSAFGTFYPHFGEMNPNTGNKELTVEFVPTKEMLAKIGERKLEQLSKVSLN